MNNVRKIAKSIVKNWKTTVLGLAAFVAIAVNQYSDTQVDVADVQNSMEQIVLAIIGFVALLSKDGDADEV